MNKFNIAPNGQIMLHGFRVPEGAIYGKDEDGIYICTNFRTKNGYYMVYRYKKGDSYMVTKTSSKKLYHTTPYGETWCEEFENGIAIGHHSVLEKPQNVDNSKRARRHLDGIVYDKDLWIRSTIHKLSPTGKGITNIIKKFSPVVVANYKQPTRANTNIRATYQDTRPKTDYKHPVPCGIESGKTFAGAKKESIWKEKETEI